MLVSIAPKLQDLGGFQVGRLLPSVQRRNVGPFIFLDRMGPARFAPGDGIDVRPHPHIGLSTLTYLFEGAIRHRDSVGSVQDILPGDVNWMVAGRGIVHSERTPPAQRESGHALDGLQCWLALPHPQEECAPAFHHFDADGLPLVETNGFWLRLVAGHGFGRCAPVPVAGDTLFAEIRLEAGGALELPDEHAERAVYPLDAGLAIDGLALAPGTLHVLPSGWITTLSAERAARCVLLGGAPLDGPRHLWWNFVSSSRERLEQAKADWREERFAAVPGETERIPLPER